MPSVTITARIAIFLLGLLAPAAYAGDVFLTKDEALKLAFEDCEITRSTVTLTADQKDAVAKLSGEKLNKNLVYPYVAKRNGKVVGTAWFDVHKVRTLRETMMIVVDPEGKISRIEILAFGEPREYMPRTSWYAQFVGKGLDAKLALGKGIKKVTGASLTARATTNAARRVLAIHQVWGAGASPKPKPKKREGAKGK